MENRTEGISWALSSIGNRLPQLRYLSYSFYGAWILLSVTGVDLVSFSGADDAVARFLRNYMLSGIPLTACLFLAGALDSFFNERIAHGPLTVVMAIIASASTFVVAASHDVGSLACDIAMVGTGLGTAFVCLRVGLVTSRLSGTEACVTISSAALLSFLIYFAVKGAPGDISVVLVSLLPFASVFCSFCVPDEVSETDPLEEAISIDKLPQGFFVRLVLAVCAFALAAGVSKGIGMIVVSGASTPVECIVSLVCIAGFILGLCLLLRTRNFNVSSLYLPIGLLMAFAMLGTPILGSPDIVQSAITGVLYNIFVIRGVVLAYRPCRANDAYSCARVRLRARCVGSRYDGRRRGGDAEPGAFLGRLRLLRGLPCRYERAPCARVHSGAFHGHYRAGIRRDACEAGAAGGRTLKSACGRRADPQRVYGKD